MAVTDDCTGGRPLVTRHATPEEPLSNAISNAVAIASNAAVTALPPLGYTVDPEAMEAVFDTASPNGRFAFEYAGHRVTVSADRTVTVYPLD